MTDPLIFFIHVPKTAGSTVNFYLQQNNPNGMAHIEHIINDVSKLEIAANSLSWISGHVTAPAAESSLKAVTNRRIRFFSLVRCPKEQVASHYNWLFEMHARGPHFYERVPDWAKEMSERVRSTGDGVAAVLANLVEFQSVFMNFQARHVLGPNLASTEPFESRFSRYEMIATDRQIDALLSRMTGKKIAVERWENASPYRFDKQVFDDERVISFLAKHNCLDEAIYRWVLTQRSGIAK